MIYGVPEGFDQNKNSDLCHTVMGFALPSYMPYGCL